MSLSEELLWRGMIKDKTFDDIKWLDTPKKFYLGVDCGSSNSLTIGNLAIYRLARLLTKRGWNAVLLVGGATSLIGDPGGKDEERELKSVEEIQHNVDGIKVQVERVFSGEPFELVNNYDWFKDIGYLEFLRDVGKHYSMTELIQREFIASRMGEGGGGISYAEFSYNLIQGYDFWWLFKNKGVELQIGGSDQWGNMISGAPLVRKKEGKEVHALSMPLVVNKSTGKKFGKSEDGAVWLAPEKTSPTKFYQFWINVDDEDVEGYLKIYTDLSRHDIEEIVSTHKSDPKNRIAQKRLAQEVTKIVHGDQQMHVAEQLTRVLINDIPVGDMSELEIEAMRKELSSTKAEVGNSLIDVIVRCGLASSNSEARQLMNDKAIYINNKVIENQTIQNNDFQNGRLLIRKGKVLKNTALVEQS